MSYVASREIAEETGLNSTELIIDEIDENQVSSKPQIKELKC